MGKETRGIYPDDGSWQVDKHWRGTRVRQRGFQSFAEAEQWLIKELEKLRAVVIRGERPSRTLDQAAAHYVETHANKVSLETDIFVLKPVVAMCGHLRLEQVHDGSLAEFIKARLAAGCKHKTVNSSLAIVSRILSLAATKWRDEEGNTWLERVPAITKLPLVGFQREPRPISWQEQAVLLSRLPPHLRRMSLFALNTGARDDVICSLRWAWELKIPELGVSVFVVPREKTKGRRREHVLILNSVAQSVVEEARGHHETHVFTWRRERVKNLDLTPEMDYSPIETMSNTAWQRVRREAGLGDLHVHDLRHTFGMRLREAGVPQCTISDLLWHSTKTITLHYSIAQIVEFHAALEKIREDNGRWNKSIAMLKREQEAAGGMRVPQKSPTSDRAQRKTG